MNVERSYEEHTVGDRADVDTRLQYRRSCSLQSATSFEFDKLCVWQSLPSVHLGHSSKSSVLAGEASTDLLLGHIHHRLVYYRQHDSSHRLENIQNATYPRMLLAFSLVSG